VFEYKQNIEYKKSRYCYANFSDNLVKSNLKKYNPSNGGIV